MRPLEGSEVYYCQHIKIEEGRLDLFYFYFLFYFQFIFQFSIFRTIRVRVDLSHCHISHNMMTKSQDGSRDIGELSRRF